MSRTTRRYRRGSQHLVLAVAAAVALAALAPASGAQTVSELNARIAAAQSQADALGAEIQQKAEQLASARAQAAAAAQREAQLSAVLARGEERAAELAARAREARADLRRARARLARALDQLRSRLVAIYQGGVPGAIEVLLSSRGFDDLATRSELLGRIQDADADLAARVRRLRNQVAARLAAVERAHAEQLAFNRRVAAARDQMAAVRARAESTAAALEQARAEEQAALSSLQSQVATWEQQVQEAQQVSAETATSTVASWFGDWAIPEAIVMCESGGNFHAVNPSSGAGGAYQILPSTWHLYGGSGLPQDASPAEQSRIAAEIWADSGASAWECAQ